jgi:hypothetical protein
MVRVILPASFFVLLLAASLAVAQCPLLKVTAPEGLTNLGDPMTFRLNSPKADLKYFWTVSAGTITEGQGTAVIVVSTDRSMAGADLTAIVEVQGLRPDCLNRVSSSSAIATAISCGLVMDEWEGLKANDERARLDSFFAELSNNPFNIGFIVLEVTEQERFKASNKRLQLAVKHARYRGFDLSRLWFVLDRTGRSRTAIYRVPPGADVRPCDSTCITIKGGDL